MGLRCDINILLRGGTNLEVKIGLFRCPSAIATARMKHRPDLRNATPCSWLYNYDRREHTGLAVGVNWGNWGKLGDTGDKLGVTRGNWV